MLRRRVGESIHLGEVSAGTYPIKLMVLEVRQDGAVKLGIEAPPEINVVRSELLDQDGVSAATLPVRSAT